MAGLAPISDRDTFPGLRTVNRWTVVKRGQLIAGQLIAWTHNRADT